MNTACIRSDVAGRTRWVTSLAVLALLLGACGDSAAPAGDEGGASDAGGVEPDPFEDEEGNPSGADVDGGPGAQAQDTDGGPSGCPEGEQDNDGDGECAEACSDAVDCGMGSCVDDTGSILCLCDPHFAGEACDECDVEYAGDDCTECAAGYVASSVLEGSCVPDACEDVDCGAHGACAMVDDGPVCVCDTGWAGDGTCDSCADGYTGAACDTCDANYVPDGNGGCVAGACVGVDCGNGHCVPTLNGSMCVCDTGWDGGDCSECRLGYLSKNGGCVLELPVQTGNLTLHLDMAANNYLKTEAGQVVLWRSDVPATGQQNAVYDGDLAHAPQEVKVAGLTLLKFSGNQSLRLADVSMTADTYSVFIAMDPDSGGPATMAPLGGVLATDATKTGFALRTQKNATEVYYLHRSPYGTTGGDTVLSGPVTDPA